MTRLAAEIFRNVSANTVIDLGGEEITGSNVDVVPEGVTILNGHFVGQTQIFDAHNLTIRDCTFTDTSGVELQGLLRMLGGTGWHVTRCRFMGGTVASQMGVGLNSRASGVDSFPTNWIISSTTFEQLSGQWGTYPQGHNIYVLTSPEVNMGGLIDHCTLMGSPFGAALKLGGTGFQPHTEGSRGVVTTTCEIHGVPDAAGRCLAVLTQGEQTDVILRGCTLIGDGAVPWVQGMDGARLRMEQTQLPQGVTEYATWYMWRVFTKSDKKTVKPGTKPPTCGGISWI